MSIDFRCDLNAPPSPLRHPWRDTVGSGHAPLALRSDWQNQLKQARDDLGFRYVRFHGLLCEDMGTLICQSDALLYSFFNIDRIFDFLLSIGMKPFVELSFMPATLSSGGTTVFHYRGNVTPPKDYDQWGTLMRKLAAHWVERYGVAEVAQWRFEVWNEPNLAAFWTGSRDDYFKLYRTTAAAIKSVSASLPVGGPATAENAWLPEFLDFCKTSGAPADFVSTHYYPTDAFGEIGADTITQLEHAPKDVMRLRALEARVQAGQRPLYYSEWNITSNPRDPLHDQSFAAAYAVKICMSVDSIVDAYSYWTFSDIFEENYFPSVPFHGGFGLLNLYGIPKPIYRAFQMMRGLGDEQIAVEGSHETVSIWVGQDRDRRDGATRVLLVNQAMPRHAIADEAVRLLLLHGGCKPPRAVSITRVDADNANPLRAWQALGEPEYLSPAQRDAIMASSVPVIRPCPFQEENGMTVIAVDLPQQSVALLRIERDS